MIVLVIVFLFLIGVLVLFLVNTKPQEGTKCKIVKAGEISKLPSLTATINNLDEKIFVYNGEKQNISDYDIFVVDGESMAQNGIHTGNGILVKKLYGEQKLQLYGFPLIVFEIDPNRKKYRNPEVELSVEPEYKLRKFVAYFKCGADIEADLQRILEINPLLADNKDDIVERYKNAIKYYEGIDQLIISSTCRDGAIGYSFHPVKYLIGEVKYIIPQNAIKL